LGFIVIAETEIFKSSENGVSHIVCRSLLDKFAPITLCKGEAITHNGDPKQAERGQENNAQILGADTLVNHQSQQLRTKQVCRRHDEQAQESSERSAPIFPQVAQSPPEVVHRNSPSRRYGITSTRT